MPDIIDEMVDAHDKEWLLWRITADKSGVRSVHKTGYTLSRGKDVKLKGDYYETQEAFDKMSNRAAMIAAVRVFTDIPLEELGINEFS